MKKIRILIIVILLLISPLFFFLYFKYFSKAALVKANIIINVNHTTGDVPDRWLALAQGGEEKGVRMLGNVVPEITALNPEYIRIDHIYDFYDVVTKDDSGNLTFNWNQLDNTVCDIYKTGAKPFFSLGYMPPVMSSDGSLISAPTNWQEWSLLIQKTIERYSGKSSLICGYSGTMFDNVYYEVWNEPDLESFGKWSLYGGNKDYKTLYYYSALGASKAQDVNKFMIGGPATTAIYQSWIQRFLDYTMENNLRIDFLSWHHYSKNTDDFTDDIGKLNSWLSEPKYQAFQQLPRIVSEWGYDSDPNPMADTNAGAAHTIAAIRNFVKYNFALGFLFDIKDGPFPRWGILSHEGNKKPRYFALKLLTLLEGKWLNVEGEGSLVTALASTSPRKTTVVLVNYDPDNKNVELVPLTITGIDNGNYTMTLTYLQGTTTNIRDVKVENNQLQRSILMPVNTVVAVELQM